jgi:hypothetical protein
MWHDLVLHGVGGATVEEAKGTMSHAEVMAWVAFTKKRGHINLADRIDAGFAMLAHVICAMHGKKTKVSDFMPKRGEPQEASIGAVFNMLKANSRGK